VDYFFWLKDSIETEVKGSIPIHCFPANLTASRLNCSKEISPAAFAMTRSSISFVTFNGFPKEVSHPQGMCRA